MQQLRGTPLKRFLRDWRREHPQTRDIVLVLQSVSYPVNVGSLFRIADAVNVRHMYLCGATPTPPNKTIMKVGRNKDTDVRWSYEKNAEDVLVRLRDEGYHISALGSRTNRCLTMKSSTRSGWLWCSATRITA